MDVTVLLKERERKKTESCDILLEKKRREEIMRLCCDMKALEG